MAIASSKTLALATIHQLPKSKLEDHVYEELCSLILNGEIEPGQLVTINALSEAFGVSAMPVRAALQRLTASKALTVISGRSIGIPPLTAGRLLDLTRVRMEVEGTAAKWSADNVSEAGLHQLQELVASMADAVKQRDAKAYLRANKDFHFTIYKMSGSETACDIIRLLWLQVAPYFHYLRGSDNYTEANGQHDLILQALSSGDGVAAKQAIHHDIETACRVMLRTLE